LPNSTMDIKCPLPKAGYITMVSFMFENLEKEGYVFWVNSHEVEEKRLRCI
jgi:hypothetical protein